VAEGQAGTILVEDAGGAFELEPSSLPVTTGPSVVGEPLEEGELDVCDASVVEASSVASEESVFPADVGGVPSDGLGDVPAVEEDESVDESSSLDEEVVSLPPKVGLTVGAVGDTASDSLAIVAEELVVSSSAALLGLSFLALLEGLEPPVVVASREVAVDISPSIEVDGGVGDLTSLDVDEERPCSVDVVLEASPP